MGNFFNLVTLDEDDDGGEEEEAEAARRHANVLHDDESDT